MTTKNPQPRSTLTAKLPTGREIVLREISGDDELFALAEVGQGQGMAAQWQTIAAQVNRALVSIDGQRIEPSEHATARDLFSAVEWQLVCDAFNCLHRPAEAQVTSFRASFRLGVES